MPIYSNNRTGSMALAQVAANESYTSEDFGRILYESQVNDMAFFEAALACDFNEVKGIREGTILEAEVKEMNNKSKNSWINTQIERLKVLWGKIKGAFQDAINKVAAYVLKDAKAFVKEFNIAVNKRIGSIDKWNGNVESVVVFDYHHDIFSMPDNNVINTMCQTYSDDKGIKSNEIVNAYLSALCGKNDIGGIKGYTTFAMETARKTETLNKSNIEEYLTALDGAKEYIAALKKAQRDAEATVNGAIGDLKSEVGKENVASLNQAVSAFEAIIVAISKANIAVTKMDIKSRRSALSKVLSDITKASKEAKNADAKTAAHEAACALDYKLVLTESERADVAKLVAAIA